MPKRSTWWLWEGIHITNSPLSGDISECQKDDHLTEYPRLLPIQRCICCSSKPRVFMLGTTRVPEETRIVPHVTPSLKQTSRQSGILASQTCRATFCVVLPDDMFQPRNFGIFLHLYAHVPTLRNASLRIELANSECLTGDPLSSFRTEWHASR